MKYRLWLVFVLLLVPSAVWADSPSPMRDLAKVSSNGEYIFVLLPSGDDISTCDQRGTDYLMRDMCVRKDTALRQKYHQSGLYRNDGSTTPLWTVDWNAHKVEISSDGHHLLRYGPWPVRGRFDETALIFYRDGQEIQRYTVEDLVAQPEQLPETVSHYTWEKDILFDGATGRLSVTTHNDEHYIFSASGQLIEGTPGRNRRWSIFAIAPVLLIGAVLITLVIIRQRRRPPIPNPPKTPNS